MIAKRIDTKAATPRIARLVKYVVAAQGGIDPRSWSRTADYMLNSGTSSKGEKVGGVRVSNCHTDDPAAATALIECTQAGNTRSKTDKTYHLVFSFPPGEEPDLKTLHAIEDQLCAAIGYADHQRISAVHIDTDHLHVHVAINKVHPQGFQNIEPYYDKKKLMEACERLEIEYGLIRTNHGLHGETPKAKVKPKQAQAEAHSGVETLTGFVARELAQRLKDAKSWKEAHALLAENGLEIKLRGAGLVIGSKDLWVKASQCDRDLSFKAMKDRLGPFEKAGKPTKAYEPKPRQQHPSSEALYAQYKELQRKHKLARNYDLARMKYEGALLEANLQRWRVAQRLLVKVAAKGPKRRAMLKIITLQTANNRARNRKAINERRHKMIQETAMPSWANWLAQAAENGSDEALDVMRSRQGNQAKFGDYMTVEKPEITRNTIIHHLRHYAQKDGSINYYTQDGCLVVDRKEHIQLFQTSQDGMIVALNIASKRFNGQPLIIEGTEDFQKEAARLAGLHAIKIQFANAEMEKIRKAGIPAKANKRQQPKEADI